MIITGEGKVAVVIGGGQTLGAFLCKGLAENGFDVACLDINKRNAQKVAEDIKKSFPKITVIGLEVDATNEVSVEKAFEIIKKDLGVPYLMIYSAGIASANKITDFIFSDWEKSLAVNLTGYFLSSKYVARHMIAHNIQGSIIQINSKSGKVGSKHNAGYSAAKFGGWGLTQTLALDLAEHGIRVHSLMLGNLLSSPLFHSLKPQYAKKLGILESEVEQVYIDKVPMKRGCEYSDVLSMILFYSSEFASYETGQALNITGGQVMH
ncbi:MAG: sorbitol-6-phosphate dehydrogenase [Brevinema sp.]